MASILVVEDEPAIQELLRVNLEDAGFSRARGAPMPRARTRAITQRAARSGAARLDAAGTVGTARSRARCAADARTRELPDHHA